MNNEWLNIFLIFWDTEQNIPCSIKFSHANSSKNMFKYFTSYIMIAAINTMEYSKINLSSLSNSFFCVKTSNVRLNSILKKLVNSNLLKIRPVSPSFCKLSTNYLKSLFSSTLEKSFNLMAE
jgi:hypothetical protein